MSTGRKSSSSAALSPSSARCDRNSSTLVNPTSAPCASTKRWHSSRMARFVGAKQPTCGSGACRGRARGGVVWDSQARVSARVSAEPGMHTSQSCGNPRARKTSRPWRRGSEDSTGRRSPGPASWSCLSRAGPTRPGPRA
eukprot:3623660-Rhodomonas_salina.3